jgi:hypothetical protein
VVALGSVLGTLKDTVDEMRVAGARIGALGITRFRLWPLAAVREALAGVMRGPKFHGQVISMSLATEDAGGSFLAGAKPIAFKLPGAPQLRTL